MAIDKVRSLKIENPAEGGTQTDYLPTEVNPSQDYLSAAGLSLQDSNVDVISLSADNNPQSPSYSSSLFNSNHIPNDNKNYILTTNYQYINYDEIYIDGLLTVNGNLVVFS